MDVTTYIVAGREKALLIGDYGTYRTQLSRRLLAVRKRLGRATKKGAKYSKKAPVTAEDIASNHEFVHLQLLVSERAWAHAMMMKSAHSNDASITGPTRSHIISRLHKASTYADELLSLLKDQTSGATPTDILEARAYAAYIRGAVDFEKQNWKTCLNNYSEAWVIYTALALATKKEVFKELISSTVEPSIRYAAYQEGVPRTVGEPAIARKYCPSGDAEFVSSVEKLQPGVLKESSKQEVESRSGPTTITWRTRQIELEDASIAQALGAVADAQSKLAEELKSIADSRWREKAAAYDDILIKSQDAVDATKHAIDELVTEGISQGDKRMQSLQITKTAVSYDLISWRIGRNRVLAGEKDGALPPAAPIARPRGMKKEAIEAKETELSTGRKLAGLRERVVLYDAILQSLETIKELPGAAADASLLKEIDAKYGYFQALKCLSIARSHTVLSNHKNALALLSRASTLSSTALPSLIASDEDAPPSILVSASQAKSLQETLQSELQKERALLELSSIVAKRTNGAAVDRPLVERLHEFPTEPVDLHNLVTYPPKLEPVPVKPLFFDAAWNYIEYPGRTEAPAKPPTAKPAKEEKAAAPQKKGWFGFGR